MAESADRMPAGWFRTLIDTVPSHVFIKDADGRFLLVNEALARFLGTTVEQMVGRTEHDFDIALSEEQWSELLRQDRELMRTRAATELEVQLRAADGQLRRFRTVKVPLVGGDGACDRLLFVSTDITEHRRAEEAAGESRHLVRRILDTTPNLIYIYDLLERRNVYANREVTDFLGYTAEQIRTMGSSLFERILHPDDIARVAAHHARCVAAGDDEVLEIEYRMRHATGEWRWLHSRDTVFSRSADGSVRQILGATVDMTEQKRHDAERRDLEAQLAQSQKMEAIGQLAGGVAHDFNNLLTAISGYVELVRAAAPVELHGDLAEIGAAAERAAGLTRQLLAFSRKQVLVPTVLDLNVVIAETAKMLTRLIGEHIEFAWSGAADLGRVRADRGQLQQVLVNLAVNARDAMPGGGRLSISTANADIDPESARYRSIPPGRYVELAVSDTGWGMSPEVQARIFEPFFTTKGPEGTGLGLATVYGIVRQSDGYITVDSRPGQGTSFTIFLPRVDEDQADSSSARAEAPANLSGRTVLVVDDEERVRALTARILASLECEVLTASGCDEAVEVAGRHAGRVDLLLTDVTLQGPSGFEIARRLREKDPSLAVVFMSGYADPMELPEALGRAGTTYLPKPFTAIDLQRAIGMVLEDPKS